MAPPLVKTEETTSRPFSLRQEVGEGFILGSVLGSALYLPAGGFQAVWTKVPRLSCQFAVMSGALGAIHSAMVSANGKEERVLNTAVAAAGAGGITNIPMGVRTAACTALVGGAFAGAFQAGLDKLSAQHKDDPRATSS